MYEYADKVIEKLNKYFIAQFDRLNIVADDKFLITANELYKKLTKKCEGAFLDIALLYYEDILEKGNKPENKPNLERVRNFLKEYNPVTKYSFYSEAERKAARFAESVIATNGKRAEIKVALRYWANMVMQYGIDITDYAVLSAYKDNGVKEVIWITAEDNKVCEICAERDGKVYKINKIPPKPHLNCRCYVIPKS